MNRKPEILVAIRLLLPAALAVSAVASCTTTKMVRVEQLQRLDGYEADRVSPFGRPIEALDGETVRYGSDANLYLGVTGKWVGGRFDSIRVRDGRFEGRTAEGVEIQAPMDEITAAKVAHPNYFKGFLVVGGVLLGLSVIGGLVFLSTFAPQGGRALRIRGKSVAAPLVISDGWRKPDIRPDISSLSPEARGALAAAWASSARSEHASVPAFSRLSLSLVSLGAPSHLVQAALRAALEEIEHARLSFALAEGYALTPMGPGPLAELTSAPAVTVTSRADLARESLVDGCLLEGAAAAYAQVAHDRASDPAVRAALAVIARDETSHTELAWEIARWGCRQADVDFRRRMLELVRDQRTPRAPVDVPPRLSSELEAHGWPDAAVWHDLFERTRADLISRFEREILAAAMTPVAPARSSLPRCLLLGVALLFNSVACSDDGGNGTGTAGTSGGGTGGAAAGTTGTGGGGGTAASLTLTSTAFGEGMTIPAAHTCAGGHMSPALSWTAGPSTTMSYGIALVDMSNNLVHWTIWDIPATTLSLPGNLPTTHMLSSPTGAKQVNFSTGDGYFGPCPNGALHTYVFQVFAIDVATLPNVTATSMPMAVRTQLMTRSIATGTLSGTSNASMN